jgi:hypothetical protein
MGSTTFVWAIPPCPLRLRLAQSWPKGSQGFDKFSQNGDFLA